MMDKQRKLAEQKVTIRVYKDPSELSIRELKDLVNAIQAKIDLRLQRNEM